MGYKVVTGAKPVKLHEMDLITGVREFDEDHEKYQEKQRLEDEREKTWYGKIWKYTGGALLG